MVVRFCGVAISGQVVAFPKNVNFPFFNVYIFREGYKKGKFTPLGYTSVQVLRRSCERGRGKFFCLLTFIICFSLSQPIIHQKREG